MKKNILKLIFLESPYRLRLLLIASVIGLCFFQQKTIKWQQTKLSAISKQKRLSEKASKIKREKPKMVVMPKIQPRLPDVKYTLEGMIKEDGKFLALINGALYLQGDRIDDFIIDEVTMNSTVLRRKKTNEVRRLYFKDDDITLKQ